MSLEDPSSQVTKEAMFWGQDLPKASKTKNMSMTNHLMENLHAAELPD
jgi:hypothetical protein